MILVYIHRKQIVPYLTIRQHGAGKWAQQCEMTTRLESNSALGRRLGPIVSIKERIIHDA